MQAKDSIKDLILETIDYCNKNHNNFVIITCRILGDAYNCAYCEPIELQFKYHNNDEKIFVKEVTNKLNLILEVNDFGGEDDDKLAIEWNINNYDKLFVVWFKNVKAFINDIDRLKN